MRLKTRRAELAYERSIPAINEYLGQIDSSPVASVELGGWRSRVERLRMNSNHMPDAYLDDLFVLDRCIDFLSSYAATWRLIAQGRITESWNVLQNSIDQLRLIRSHSEIDTSFFSDQLLELEKCYQYNVFFSVGAVVKRIECSLCGFDIDSEACLHRKGHLYRGRMAYGIAREAVEVNHVSMVKNPKDKRCVVTYEDSDPRFSILHMLGELLNSNRLKVSCFRRLEFSKRNIPNPDYKCISRNDSCFCGSGIKFKKCCLGKESIEQDHVEIIAYGLARNAGQHHPSLQCGSEGLIIPPPDHCLRHSR